MSFRILLSPPHLDGDERDLLLDALDSNWVAPLGPHVDAFEDEMASALGGDVHAVALSSGTAALHLALLLHGVGPGDEVVCPTLTFAATANAIRYTGALPVLVDAEPDTWQIDPALVERAAVLQAATLGRNGEVLVLDMGEPVNIVELAESMTRLSGLKPYDDVDIHFTGLRPGEKLFAELALTEEGAEGTRHPKIFIGHTATPNWSETEADIAQLERATNRLGPHRVACDAQRARARVHARAGWPC